MGTFGILGFSVFQDFCTIFFPVIGSFAWVIRSPGWAPSIFLTGLLIYLPRVIVTLQVQSLFFVGQWLLLLGVLHKFFLVSLLCDLFTRFAKKNQFVTQERFSSSVFFWFFFGCVLFSSQCKRMWNMEGLMEALSQSFVECKCSERRASIGGQALHIPALQDQGDGQ